MKNYKISDLCQMFPLEYEKLLSEKNESQKKYLQEYFKEIRHVDSVLKAHMPEAQQYVFGHHAGKLRVEHRRNEGDGHMIVFQNTGAFGGRTDSAFTTGADAFAAADTLFNYADGLLIFNPDGLGGAVPQT